MQESERVLREVQRVFRPELLNRIDETVVFHPLNKEALMAIASLLAQEISERAAALGYSLRFTPEALELIVSKGSDKKYGARPLRRAMIRLVEEPLSRGILEGLYPLGASLLCHAEGDEMAIRPADEP